MCFSVDFVRADLQYKILTVNGCWNISLQLLRSIHAFSSPCLCVMVSCHFSLLLIGSMIRLLFVSFKAVSLFWNILSYCCLGN